MSKTRYLGSLHKEDLNLVLVPLTCECPDLGGIQYLDGSAEGRNVSSQRFTQQTADLNHPVKTKWP